MTKVAKSSGRKAKNAAQSGARSVVNTVARARSISPSLRPRSTSSGSGSFRNSGSEEEQIYREDRVRNNSQILNERSDDESSEERQERRARRDFYENRGNEQSTQRSPRSESPRSEYWKNPGGYGYGLGWRTRYRWFPLLFTPSVYTVWYPHSRWEPYYILENSFVEAFERDFTLPPNSAFRINTRVRWPTNLPPLPKFKEVGINLAEIRYQTEQLTEQQRTNIMKVQHDINVKLAELKLRFNTYVNRGYWPVPDLDREQFSWVKVIQ